jgi:hypothetical protein
MPRRAGTNRNPVSESFFIVASSPPGKGIHSLSDVAREIVVNIRREHRIIKSVLHLREGYLPIRYLGEAEGQNITPLVQEIEDTRSLWALSILAVVAVPLSERVVAVTSFPDVQHVTVRRELASPFLNYECIHAT